MPCQSCKRKSDKWTRHELLSKLKERLKVKHGQSQTQPGSLREAIYDNWLGLQKIKTCSFLPGDAKGGQQMAASSEVLVGLSSIQNEKAAENPEAPTNGGCSTFGAQRYQDCQGVWNILVRS